MHIKGAQAGGRLRKALMEQSFTFSSISIASCYNHVLVGVALNGDNATDFAMLSLD